MPAPDQQDVLNLFQRHFGFRPAHVTRAPAGIGLLGTACEACKGLALTAAVDRHAFAAASPRTDGKIGLVRAGLAPESFWISDLRPNPAAPWADLTKGVLRELRQRGVHFSGFNAALHSGIPTDPGLGADAAAAVAAALMVRSLFPFTLTDGGLAAPPERNERGGLPPLPAPERLPLARACAAALDASGGDGDGFVEAITSLAGKPWCLLSLDCRSGSMEHLPLPGVVIIICDSGARPADAVPAMEIRGHCLGAALKLQAGSLRSVEPKFLRAHQASLGEREFACAAHVTSEIQRAAGAERALRADDHRQFGAYLTLSHESLRTNLGARSPDLDLLVELARTHEACLGTRALGAGHSGATASLVLHHAAGSFMAAVARGYEAATGRPLKPLVCQMTGVAA